MKRFTLVVIVLAAAMLLAAACGQPAAAPAVVATPTAAATPKPASPVAATAAPSPTQPPAGAPSATTAKAPSPAVTPVGTTPPGAITPTALATRAVVPTLSPTISARYPVTVTDDAGRTVRIDKQPQRFVSLAPSNTEILFALDLGAKVVGVTDFCDYPAAAQSIPKIGGVKANLEKIVAISPDLVLSIGGNADLVKRLTDLKIAVIVLDPKDIGGILRDLEMVGAAAGVGERSAKLVSNMQARMDAVTVRLQGANLPRVFYELDATDPAKPYTAGPGSWHDQLITMAGGSNVASSAKSAWVQFSMEELIKADPEIIVLGDAMFGTSVDSAKKRTGWSGITAVKRNAVYPIDDNLVSRPGPRLADGLEALAKLLHPEIFK